MDTDNIQRDGVVGVDECERAKGPYNVIEVMTVLLPYKDNYK